MDVGVKKSFIVFNNEQIMFCYSNQGSELGRIII